MRRAAIVVSLVGALLAVIAAGSAAAAPTFTFYGSGWGHGLGMSQYGADGLALQGWSHQRILRHFYRGTTVGPARWSPATLRIGLAQEARKVHVKAVSGTVRLRLGNAATGTVLGGRAIPVGSAWSITPVGAGSFRIRDASGKVVASRAGSRLYVSYATSGGHVFVREAGFTYARGSLEIDVYSGDGCGPGACLRVVALLSPQSYMDGLGEMPSSWPMEALMAQADAARTYAFEKVARLGQHRPRCNCGLYASTWDQAYVGWEKESGAFGSRWVSAVARTNREIVRYHGRPIQAYYTSSSGGYTESNQNVWGGSPIPYLQGTCDPGDDVSANPNRVWRVGPLSAFTVTSRLLPFTGTIGTVTGFTNIVRGVSGRVITLVVVGTNRRATLSGSSLKWALGLNDDRVWINVDKNVTGRIRARYDALDCAPGLPTGPQTAVRGGRAQPFEDGTLYWNAARRRVYWLHGAALAFYRGAGGPSGYLGLPASDVLRDRAGSSIVRFGHGNVVVCGRRGMCIDHAAADLSVSIGAHGSAVVGASDPITVTVRNRGPGTSHATLAVRLPAGVPASSTNASQGSCASTPIVACDLGRVAAGARVTVVVRVAPAAAGPLVIRATVAGTGPDPHAANNSATRVVGVAVPSMRTRVSSPWFSSTIGSGVSWSPTSGTGSGLVFEVRYRSARLGGRLGPYRTWKLGTRLAADVFQGRMGSTYCFSARARDRAGHRSAWSPDSCSAVPLDDIALSRAGGWTRNRGDITFYRGTSSVSTTDGAWVEVTGVRARRVAILVRTCPGCGTIGVSWNGTLLARVSLASPTARLRQVVARLALPAGGSGTLRITVVSSGKPVLVDGVGFSAV